MVCVSYYGWIACESLFILIAPIVLGEWTKHMKGAFQTFKVSCRIMHKLQIIQAKPLFHNRARICHSPEDIVCRSVTRMTSVEHILANAHILDSS